MKMRESLERIAELVRKEFRQVLRDPRMRGIIFVAPVIQLLVFGYAVSTDVKNTTLFVVDQDRSEASRVGRRRDDLERLFPARGPFGAAAGPGLRARPRRRDRRARGPGRLRSRPRPAERARPADPRRTNSNVATVARGYAERMLLEWSLARGGIDLSTTLEVRERAWFNAGLSSRELQRARSHRGCSCS